MKVSGVKMFGVKKIIFFTIFLYAILQLVNVISHFLLFDRTSYELIYGIATPVRWAVFPWLNFDGMNYLTITIFGYAADPTLSAFFPLFPIIIRILSLNLFFNPIIVGLLFSFFVSIATAVLFFRIIKEDFSGQIAFRALLCLLLFPTSYYLFAFYTESLFLFLSLCVFYFLKQQRLILASIFVMLASLTKIFGVLLFPLVFLEAIVIFRNDRKIKFAVLLAPLGLLFYMIYNWMRFGDLFLMIKSQTSTRFARDISFLSPITQIVESYKKVVGGPSKLYDSNFVYPVILMEIGYVLLALFTLFIIYKLPSSLHERVDTPMIGSMYSRRSASEYKKLNRRYFLYSLLYIGTIFYSGGYSSIGRYLLVLFPIHIIVATFKTKYYIIWISISVLMLVFSASLFFRNYWIS